MFQKIKFTDDVSLTIIEDYDEENDETEEVNENFLKGETCEWDVLDDHRDNVDVQFGDGSVCYGIPKDSFIVLEESE